MIEESPSAVIDEMCIRDRAALVTTCLAMARTLEEKGVRADVTAGLSLGEYCAIAVAGGMSDLDAVWAVRKRGVLMEGALWRQCINFY